MNNALENLQQEYRRIRRNILLFIPFIALCGLCLFWSRTVALILLGLAVALQLFVLRRQQQQYAEHVTTENLLQTICPKLNATAPDVGGGGELTRGLLIASALLPIDDSRHACLLRQGITGTASGMSIRLCDATLAQTFSLATKGKRRVHYNAGTWIQITLPQDSGGDWRLLDETSVPTPIRMDYFATYPTMETAPLPDDTLAPRMVLYRSVEQEHQQPSPATLRQLRKLVEYTPGYLAVSLRGATLDIFIRGRFVSRPVSMSSAPTATQLQFDPLPELDYCIQLAKAITKDLAR